MRNIAEENDAVCVKEFMFSDKEGGQIFVNNNIITGPKFTGTMVVFMTKAWHDYETGWRYHATPVNLELEKFMRDNNAAEPLKVYVSEFDIEWDKNATALIEVDLQKRKSI